MLKAANLILSNLNQCQCTPCLHQSGPLSALPCPFRGHRTFGIRIALRWDARTPPGCLRVPWLSSCHLRLLHLCGLQGQGTQVTHALGSPRLIWCFYQHLSSAAGLSWYDPFTEILLTSNSIYLLTQKTKPKKFLQSQ